VSERPYEYALHARWTLEGRIPLAGVADGASWHRARTVGSQDPVTLFVVEGDQALEVADAARRAYLVENARLIAVQDVVVLEDVPAADPDDGSRTTVTVVQYGMPPAPPLAALMSEGPMRPETIRSIIGEAATGLEAARHRGLRHQFLDSNRVFVDTTHGAVTVLGVGVEAASHPDAEDDSKAAAFQDTAALCSLLFRGLTGTAPGRLSGTRVPRPSSLVERRVPEDLDVLCELVLNADGGDMPTTTRELVAELGPWQSIPVTLEAYDPDQPAGATETRPPETATTPTEQQTAVGSAAAASVAGTSAVVPGPEDGQASDSAAGTDVSDDAGTDPAGASGDGSGAATTAESAESAESAQEFVRDLHLDQPRAGSAFPGHVELDQPSSDTPEPPGEVEDATAPASPPAAPPTAAAASTDSPAVAAPSPSPASVAPTEAAPGADEHTAPDEADPEATSVLTPAEEEPVLPTGHGPIIVRGREQSVMTPSDPEPEDRAPEPSSGRGGSLFRDVVDVAMADEAPDNAYAAAAAPREERSRQSQWIIVGAALLVIVALVFAVTSITSGLRNQATGPTKTSAAPTSAAPTEEEDDEESAKPKKTKKELPEPKVDTDGVEGFAEGGNEKADYSEQADVVTDGDDSTQWKTKIYQTPQFGNLKDGLGFRIPFDKKSSLSEVTVATAENSGGTIELYQLNDDGTRGDKLADGEFAGDGDVELTPKKKVDSSGVIVWIAELPQGSQGYRAKINEISVE
jgi:hypothetical protein